MRDPLCLGETLGNWLALVSDAVNMCRMHRSDPALAVLRIDDELDIL